MNYLAHIFIAHHTNTSPLGNFLGDFVKGSDLSAFSPCIRQGIMLHRHVDSFTDSHQSVRQLIKQFPPDIRRTAGISLDVYFDHLLIKHWDMFTAANLSAVQHRFYAQLEATNIEVSPRFAQVKNSLIEHKWLSNYQQVKGVQAALHAIEKRLSRRVIFADRSVKFLHNNLDVEAGFLTFFPTLLRYSEQIEKIT